MIVLRSSPGHAAAAGLLVTNERETAAGWLVRRVLGLDWIRGTKEGGVCGVDGLRAGWRGRLMRTGLGLGKYRRLERNGFDTADLICHVGSIC